MRKFITEMSQNGQKEAFQITKNKLDMTTLKHFKEPNMTSFKILKRLLTDLSLNRKLQPSIRTSAFNLTRSLIIGMEVAEESS